MWFELGEEACQLRAYGFKREPFSCAFLRLCHNCFA